MSISKPSVEIVNPPTISRFGPKRCTSTRALSCDASEQRDGQRQERQTLCSGL